MFYQQHNSARIIQVNAASGLASALASHKTRVKLKMHLNIKCILNYISLTLY